MRKGKVVRKCGFVGRVAFKGGCIGPINEGGTADVVNGDGAVAQMVVGNSVLKIGDGGATKEPGEGPGAISSLDLSTGEHGFLLGDSLKKGVTRNWVG